MSEARYLGKYEIMEELGRGGFGVVYKARDKILERLVAVKVLHPNLINDPSFVSRFRQEAIFSARFDHPNLVPVFDFDQAEGLYYLVMGYMPGGSLKQLLKKEGALPEDRAVQILCQVGSGLAYAHRKGVIHRDLKPANILFDTENEARVSDLGFAKALRSDSSASMSMSGGMIGTPAYMAPEVWRGNLASERSDLYSLGCILYEMLTGEVLFEGETPAMAMTKHLIEGPRFRQDLSEPWKTLLLKSLAMDPENRFPSAEDFRDEVIKQRLHNSTPKKSSSLSQPIEGFNQNENEPIQPMGKPLEPNKNQDYPETELRMVVQPPLDLKRSIPGGKDSSTETPRNDSSRKAPAKKGFAIGLVIALLVVVLSLIAMTLSKNRVKLSAPPLPTETPLATHTETPTSTKTPTMTKTPLLKMTSTPIITSTPQEISSMETTKIREIDDMTMVFVPEGEFIMGNDKGYSNEKPARKVFLDAYWIDKYEVSNGQFAKCVAAYACAKPRITQSETRYNYYGNLKYDNFPVIYVSWHQAKAYCEWVGGSLPTEAQWEKAARGEDGSTFPWGNTSPNSSQANFHRNVGDTTQTCSYPTGKSPFGALNMIGNVSEWVQDFYGPYQDGYTEDSINIGTENQRVLRGGSWQDIDWWGIRASVRRKEDPSITRSFIGFRCVYPMEGE